MELPLRVVILADDSPEQQALLCELPPVEWVRLAAESIANCELRIANWPPEGLELADLLALFTLRSETRDSRLETRASNLEPRAPSIESPTSQFLLLLSSDRPLLTGETLRDFAERCLGRGAALAVLGEPEDPTAVWLRIEGKPGVPDHETAKRRNGEPAHPSPESPAPSPEDSNPQSAIRNPQFPPSPEPRIPSPDIQGPMSEDFNPQFAIRNPQLDSPLRRFAVPPSAAVQVEAVTDLPDPVELLAVRDALTRAEAEDELQERIRTHWLAAGATLRAPGRAWIGPRVRLCPPVTVWWDVALLGDTVVGAGCDLRPGTLLENARLGERVRVEYSVVRDAEVASGTTVGPFAHLRGGARIGSDNRIGNFVEVKKSTTGPGTKASHLAYLGDATIGAHVNVGAGTITCNYDGVAKHPTVIGDGAFIGSDTILVAPVEVGAGAYTGAGSTVTEPVPPDSLALGRARQRNILGWAAKRRAAQAAAKEAHHKDTEDAKKTGDR